MTEPTVTWTLDDRGIAHVTLNRPERNNAYDGSLIDGLHQALDALGAGPAPRAVVIRGNGRHFQAGADLGWLDSVRQGDAAANRAASAATASAVDRLNHVGAPVIAIVRGACIGGGTGLLSACDIVLAADTAIFAISEVRWGLTAAVIVPQLVDAIGVRQLRRYGLTGERFAAAEAMRIGLVHAVHPERDLEAAADAILAEILANAPEAVAETKALTLAQAAGNLDRTTFDSLVAVHGRKRQSEEAGEGIASFKEKRPARWAPGAKS